MQSVLARIQLRRTVAHVPAANLATPPPSVESPGVSPDLVACLALCLVRAALRGEPPPEAVTATLDESPELARAVRRRAREAARVVAGGGR